MPSVAPLAQWKRLKGLTVETVAVSTVGGSAAAIHTFLENRYASDPDLTYVLLVGDHGQLPSQIFSGYVSDLTYSCLDGEDDFPDVVLGRISVQTPAECNAVVSKIVSYERHPDAGQWHRSFLMAACLQDNNDFNCTADRWFFETGTHAMHFVRDTVGMAIATAANSSNACSPYRWRSDSYPHRFENYSGQTVPAPDASLLTSSSQATQDILTAIDAGASIVQHRDHGATWGWGDPPFGTWDVAALSNGSRYPVVFSINCLTGTFNLTSGDCFTEAILKKDPGGAVGVVAATEVSYSGYNNLLTHGLYDCFWDDYDTADGGNPYPHSFRPAEALLYGKAYMHRWMGASSYTQLEFRIFHWFGDPEMSVITDVPVTPTVSVACPLPIGAPSLTVSSDAEGALVAVTRDGQPLGRAFTSGGVAVVPLDPVPSEPGLLEVVISGHNVAPVEVSCQVIVPEGPWLAVTSHTVLDAAGNGDGIANPGEAFVLATTVENVGADGGTGLAGTLSTSSESCTVTDQLASFPDLATGQSATSEPDHFAIQIDPLAPQGTVLPLTLDWTADGPYAGWTALTVRVCEEFEISGVQLTDVTDDSARVSWTTNVPATSSVAFGIASASERQTSSPDMATTRPGPIRTSTWRRTREARRFRFDSGLPPTRTSPVTDCTSTTSRSRA